MQEKWDKRFLRVAQEISTWSKDPSKQIGAVAVNSDRRILATGYNGFPKGIEDRPERYIDRTIKYDLVVHAEMNCIYNATFNGISLKDSTLYVWGLPVCHDCAKGIIQVGINRIVMSADDIPQKWLESFDKSQRMFIEADVETEFMSGTKH
ncbi:MAG: dCMP deaminase family protein [Alphaproteobacteria bacterium TMED194]|nr:MAG: dCMP deaminase family protein [Alphaproteobacteria bacterium TMED194]|tara:strand:+ start:1812 stop:2264 length:453 start_codon:yes stop_codon:yes gene_type:complete